MYRRNGCDANTIAYAAVQVSLIDMMRDQPKSNSSSDLLFTVLR